MCARPYEDSQFAASSVCIFGFNFHRLSSEASLDKAVAVSNGSTDMVMYKLRLLPPVEVQRELVSSTENPGKENAAPMATTPPEVVLDTPMLRKRAHSPNVAFPSSEKWHSPASNSDVQQRDVLHGPRCALQLRAHHTLVVHVLQKPRPICRSDRHPQLTPSLPLHHP